jgi:hypothetical protein
MAEAFVKTFKLDHIRINSLPDARIALARIDHWRITTLNTRIPGWAIAHRESTLHHFNKPRVRSNRVNSIGLEMLCWILRTSLFRTKQSTSSSAIICFQLSKGG